jgi:starvation-inducible outer membrane lipoprotein
MHQKFKNQNKHHKEKNRMKAAKFGIIFVVMSFLFSACSSVPVAADTEAAPAKATAPAANQTAGSPDVCATDAFGCAVFKSGDAVKIGMGAPMTGGDA